MKIEDEDEEEDEDDFRVRPHAKLWPLSSPSGGED
jgi:hypothetical protein